MDATEWYTRLRADNVSREDVARFKAWLAANPQHQKDFDRLDDIWLASRDLKNTEVMAQARQNISALKAEAQRPVPWFPNPVALAALLLIAIVVGWYGYSTGQPETARYYTGLGERQSVTLKDGSTVTLNTQTTVDIKYTKTGRSLTLLQGQASFDVAGDPDRPFVVTVDNTQVAALGTLFDIYKQVDITTVTLIEGKVEVTSTPDQPGRQQTALLHAGEQVQALNGGLLSTPQKVDVTRINAWQSGKMNFDDTPLAQAIAEANRYTDLTLELADESIADLPITGIFAAGESEDFARAMENLHGVQLKWLGPKKIKIVRGE